jgi:hypothetical protein
MCKIDKVQTCSSKLAYDTCLTFQVVKQKWRKYASIVPVNSDALSKSYVNH